MEELSLEELKNGYIQHLRLRNYSELTLKQIDQGLRIFFSFLKTWGINSIKKVTPGIIEDYKRYLYGYQGRYGRPLVEATIGGRLGIVAEFFRSLGERGIILNDPTRSLVLPKRDSIIPKGIMAQDEIREIMKAPDLRDLLGYRDRTILEVLYATGIRAGELIRLKIGDLDLDNGLLRIRKAKGGKSRMAPLTTSAIRFLRRYLEKIRPEILKIDKRGRSWKIKRSEGKDHLFLTAYSGCFTQSGLSKMIKQYLQKTGIDKKITPHSFRHTCATHLLDGGMDIRYIQELLGHSNIHTTQRYTRVVIKDLKEKHRRYHPRG